MDINFQLSKIILEVLIQNGCRGFVFCPGARNAPIIQALFLLSSKYKLIVESHLDERGAAFFALGLAKSAHQSTAVITTSGTAVANLYPAMVEAFYSDVPLLAITADRPGRLHNVSANQTIDQDNFFHHFTQGYLKIADYKEFTSKDTQNLIRDLRKTVLNLAKGPVHINCPFDKPLLSSKPDPSHDGISLSVPSGEEEMGTVSGFSSMKVPKRSLEFSNLGLGSMITDFLSILKTTVRGLLILGELNQVYRKRDVFELVEVLMDKGWYVIPEVQSGMREIIYHHFHDYGWGSGRDFLLENYSLLLEKKDFIQALSVDTVVHLGGRLVSKSLSDFLKKNSGINYIHINRNTQPYNPNGVVTHHYRVDPPLFSRGVMDILYRKGRLSSEVERSLRLRNKNYRLRKIDMELTRYISTYNFLGFNELEISRSLSSFSCNPSIGREHALFLGNSMPIRDFNIMATRIGFSEVFANRGVSGIDGLVATASGIALGREYHSLNHKKRNRLYALIGDLSALHDLNSLILCRRVEKSSPVTMIVINNHEGTIFHHLPLAMVIDRYSQQDSFYYRHSYDFKGFANSFNLRYQKIDRGPLEKVLFEIHHTPHSYLLELEVNPQLNWEEHVRFRLDTMNHIDFLLA